MPQARDFHTSLTPNATCASNRCRPILAALLACCAAAAAQAVDLGDIRVHSSAGRQLRASVPLAGADVQDAEGHCFNGVVLNANREPEGALKMTVQRSANGALLLMAGTHALGEGRVTIAVENVCGTGAGREYAVMLDTVPAVTTAPAAVAQVSTPAEAAGKTKPEAPAAVLQKALAREAALSRKLKSLETNMSAVLAEPENVQLMGGKATGASKVMDEGGAPPLILKLERSLAFTEPSRVQQDIATWTESEVGVLLLALMACTGAGIFIRLRKQEQPRHWIPADTAT